MPRSDRRNDSTTAYKRTVREYLRSHGEVASKDELRAGTDVPAWYITQIASQDTFYTSLNHNSEYVASKHIIGRRSTHDGFWRPEVDDGVADRLESSVANLLSAEVTDRIVSEALQIHGANGYQRGHPLEYLYRLVRGWRIGAGTDEVQKNGIAAEIKDGGLGPLV